MKMSKVYLKRAKRIVSDPCPKVADKDFQTWIRVSAYFFNMGAGLMTAKEALMVLPKKIKIRNLTGKQQRSAAMITAASYGTIIADVHPCLLAGEKK